jgi:hypothetical protein
MTSTIAEPRGIASDGSRRQSPRRKTGLVGIVFPEMFAAAIAIAGVALIVVLDRVLGPREQQEAPLGHWTF